MKFSGERFVPSKQGMIALQHYHRYEFVLHLVDLSGKTILDIACGEGYGANLLASQAAKVYGIDISDEIIEWAKKAYTDERIHFLTGNVTNIPLQDKSIDVVVSFETIEHHDKHMEMLMEVKRVLKDNGVLIISSPDKGYYEEHMPDFKNEFHVKELYKKEFKALLEKYFKNHYTFLQNNIFGSVITCDADYTKTFTLPVHINKVSQTTGFLEPRFNIAVASDSEVEFKITTSFCTYDSDRDPFMEIEYKKQEIENIYNSMTWKIVLWTKRPLGLLKRLVKSWFTV